MEAQELIEKLGSNLGFTLSLQNDGVCAVDFDGDTVQFETVEKTLFLMTELGFAPVGDEKWAVFLRFMQANYMGAETGGATLGLSEQGAFVLHRQLIMPMEYQIFEDLVGQFIKTLRYWKEWLAMPHQSIEAEEELALPEWDMIRV